MDMCGYPNRGFRGFGLELVLLRIGTFWQFGFSSRRSCCQFCSGGFPPPLIFLLLRLEATATAVGFRFQFAKTDNVGVSREIPR